MTKNNYEIDISNKSDDSLYHQKSRLILNKIKTSINNFRKSAKVTLTKGLAALVFASGLTGCGDVLNPLGTNINGVTQAPSGYTFSGEAFEAKFKPSSKPYQKVEGKYQRPGEDWTDYQELTADSGDNYALTISSTPFYGDYKIKFRTTSGLALKEGDEETIPVYMNESQSDSALEEAINEIGVDPTLDGNPPTADTKGKIKYLEMNITNFLGTGYDGDAYTDIHSRGPPSYIGRYVFDVQGSSSETFIQAKKDAINGVSEGYLFIPPVKSVEEIKEKILEEKNIETPHNWPQIIGY